MKEVLLSAKGPVGVYLVPDIVERNLKEYCINYVRDYLKIKTYQKELRFNETDFIRYLNSIFPNEKSLFITTLGHIWIRPELPDKYKDYEWYDF